MSPCAFCDNPTHTLSNCQVIEPFTLHRLLIENARKGPGMTQQFLKYLRLPGLKRLTKHYFGRMNQSRGDLQRWCYRQVCFCFPQIRQGRMQYDIEETRRFEQLERPVSQEQIIERNAQRVRAHQRITEEFLLLIDEIGVERVEPNINSYQRFCQWMRCQSPSVFRYFNMELPMFPQVRQMVPVQPIPVPPTITIPQALPKPALKMIFQKVNDPVKSSTENKEPCCICMDTEPYIETNCHHHYCNCLLHHITKYNAKCPLCREEIKTLTYNNAEMFNGTKKIIPCIDLTIEIVE